MLTVRPAAMSDLDVMTDIEAQSFPPEEKATRESFEARMTVFPECFLLLCENGRPVGLIDGMVTNDKTISDPMFENAALHDPKGQWQSIFGFCVLPEMRGRGAAPHADARLHREGEGRRPPRPHPHLQGEAHSLLRAVRLREPRGVRLRARRGSLVRHDAGVLSSGRRATSPQALAWFEEDRLQTSLWTKSTRK